MIQQTTNAWNQMLTFRDNIARQQMQINAAAIAFKGMRIEYRAGQRSTLDVLIAEETLRDAELAKLSAEHDAYLSSALLLRFIGRLDANDIVEALPRYDPSENLRRIEHKGAMPWEPLIRRIDAFWLAQPKQYYIPAPEAALTPTIGARSSIGPVGDAKPADAIPVEPVPGTVSNVAPPFIKRSPL